MSTWTKEDEEKLEEMLARKDAARFAQRKVALEIIQLLSDDEGNPNAAWGPVQAKQIRELLAPYDEAPVMLGEFVPAGAKPEPEVVPFPYDRSPPQSVCPARGDGVYHQWGNVKAPWEEPHFICAQCNENWRPGQSLPEPPKWPLPAAPFTDAERYRK